MPFIVPPYLGRPLDSSIADTRHQLCVTQSGGFPLHEGSRRQTVSSRAPETLLAPQTGSLLSRTPQTLRLLSVAGSYRAILQLCGFLETSSSHSSHPQCSIPHSIYFTPTCRAVQNTEHTRDRGWNWTPRNFLSVRQSPLRISDT